MWAARVPSFPESINRTASPIISVITSLAKDSVYSPRIRVSTPSLFQRGKILLLPPAVLLGYRSPKYPFSTKGQTEGPAPCASPEPCCQGFERLFIGATGDGRRWFQSSRFFRFSSAGQRRVTHVRLPHERNSRGRPDTLPESRADRDCMTQDDLQHPA